MAAPMPSERRCVVGYLWYWSDGVLIHVDIWSADDAE